MKVPSVFTFATTLEAPPDVSLLSAAIAVFIAVAISCKEVASSALARTVEIYFPSVPYTSKENEPTVIFALFKLDSNPAAPVVKSLPVVIRFNLLGMKILVVVPVAEYAELVPKTFNPA